MIPVPAVGAPIPFAPVPAPAAVAFDLTSGSLHANDIVNLNYKLGRDLYNKAITAIAIPFDENSKNINPFQS